MFIGILKDLNKKDDRSIEKVDVKYKTEIVEKVEFQNGSIYLHEGVNSDPAYGYFKKLINKGNLGLCLTRSYPGGITERYKLKDIIIQWITDSPREGAITPKDLEMIMLVIEDFLLRKNEGCILILDCLNTIIANNNFRVVLPFIQSVKDLVIKHNAIFIITVNPSTIDAKQLNLIEREVDMIIQT